MDLDVHTAERTFALLPRGSASCVLGKRRRPWLSLGALPGRRAVQRHDETLDNGIKGKWPNAGSKDACPSSVRPPYRQWRTSPSRNPPSFVASPRPQRTTPLLSSTVPHEDSFRIRRVLYKCPAPSQFIKHASWWPRPRAATYNEGTHCFGRLFWRLAAVRWASTMPFLSATSPVPDLRLMQSYRAQGYLDSSSALSSSCLSLVRVSALTNT